MITLMMCCRVKGNKNSNLLNNLNELLTKVHDKNNIEILIKFDDDDEQALEVIEKIKALPVQLNYIISPRGRGYADLHLGYEALLPMIDKKSELIWVITDDLKMKTLHWDKLILDSFRREKISVCVLHAEKIVKLHKLNYERAIFKLNNYPIWSRDWIEITRFGWFYGTDAWTSILEYLLFKNYNIDNRILIKDLHYKRNVDPEIDGASAPRWQKELKEQIEIINSDKFKKYASEITRKLAERISTTGKKRITSLYQIRQMIGRVLLQKNGVG